MLYENIRKLLQEELSYTNLCNFYDQSKLKAAVFIPIVNKQNILSVLFEIRSAELMWQPGDICFPGGHIEAGENPQQAVVRETCEELRISDSDIEVIGPMNPLISAIGVTLYPYVGFLNDQKFTANPSEVAKTFTVPLHELMQTQADVGYMEVATKPVLDFPKNLLPKGYPQDWKLRTQYPVYFYKYNDYVIWGLTAQVLRNFLNILKAEA